MPIVAFLLLCLLPCIEIYMIISTLLQPLDPSISVYKGYGLSKEAESFLLSHGLKQPCFSIGASDVQDGLFGALSVCPFQVKRES